MYAAIRREPLAFDVASSPEAGSLCVPLQEAPDDDMLLTLQARITEHVRYPWAWDKDDDAGRQVLYQLGPPDPWMLALGALVWEGILQGASWDAVKVLATRALDKLRAAKVAPPPAVVSSTTTSAWRNRLSVELGVSNEKSSVDDELIGRLFIGLRICVESHRKQSSKTAPESEAPSLPHAKSGEES